MTVHEPLDRFETELLAELREVVARAGTSTVPRRPRWRRPALSVGIAAAATATVLMATSGIGPGGTSAASASDVLLGAARQVESAPQGDGTFWSVRTVETIDEGKARLTLDDQLWQQKDGSSWAAADGAPARKIKGSGFTLCDRDVDYSALQALPSEPGALRAALEDATKHGDDSAVPVDWRDHFVTDCTIGLLTMPVSGAVRGAAYRSLAALPGTANLGRTTDRQGRSGIGLSFEDGSYRQRIVIDADTGDLLQYDFIGVKGTRQGVVLTSGWTDAAPH